ncbi:hypothetical protein [Serratia fonticola]|nr:hypothetical protein [Serratia fonticola]
MNDIAQLIQSLEVQLHQPATRNDANHLFWTRRTDFRLTTFLHGYTSDLA